MLTKDYWQLIVSAVAPFLAAGAALWIASWQYRERVSCFITCRTVSGRNGPEEASLLAVHNRSSQPIAVVEMRYLSGFPLRAAVRSTALYYEDPDDVNFPYEISAGSVGFLRLDEHGALKAAERLSGWRFQVARLLKRPRFLIEVRSSIGRSYRVDGERALAWTLQADWIREQF